MPLATVADDASLSLSLLPDASFSLKLPSAVESLSRTLDFDHWSRGSGTTAAAAAATALLLLKEASRRRLPFRESAATAVDEMSQCC